MFKKMLVATTFQKRAETRIEPHLKHKLAEFNRTDAERTERLKSDLQKAGAADVDMEITTGSPKREIASRSKKEAISLVVMSSQGRGFIKEIFLGSTSHAVVRKSRVPVLLIPVKK